MKKILPFFILLLMLVWACNIFDKDFKTTETGLQYKFILKNKNAQKPQIGDILEMRMTYTYNDSIIFNYATQGDYISIQLIEPMYPGDISEGMAMMGLGDSAIFIISADSFYLKNIGLGILPDFVQSGTKLTFYVGLLGIKSREVYESEMETLQQQQNTLARMQMQEEFELRERYLRTNNLNVNPLASGLYYIEIERGRGAIPLVGSNVKVHYTGFLLDGTIFHSSYEENRPVEFKIGSGRIIEGFEEGISLMREGGKAKLIIPSELAYAGERLENIPPFSTLIYDVELISVE